MRTADTEYFPASADMCGSLVHFEPGALRQMHWHSNEEEWQFVINGTVEVSKLPGWAFALQMQGHMLAETYHILMWGHFDSWVLLVAADAVSVPFVNVAVVAYAL